MLKKRDSSKRKKKHPKVWSDFRWGLGLSLVLAAFGWWFNGQPIGTDFTWLTFRLIQRQIAPDPSRLSKIAIVDISEIRPDQKSGVTPRGELEQLLKAIAAQHPKVIGIDIDFSPEEVDGDLSKRQFVSPDDPAFFQFCSSLRSGSPSRDHPASDATQRIPVFLGVSRTERLPPDQWLAFSEYQPLAADLAVPIDNRRAIDSLASMDAKKMFGEEGVQKARTISAALAQEMRGGRKVEDCTFPFERSVDNQFYIDYSPIRSFTVISSKSLSGPAAFDQLRNISLKDKMVILGDVSDASDRFANPLERAPVAGVVVQAAAAYTAIGPPLCDIKEPFRAGADFIVAFAVLWLVAMARCYVINRWTKERWLSVFVALAVLFILGLGLSVNRSHIIWDDFLFVAIAIAIHPFADRPYDSLREKLQGKKT